MLAFVSLFVYLAYVCHKEDERFSGVLLLSVASGLQNAMTTAERRSFGRQKYLGSMPPPANAALHRSEGAAECVVRRDLFDATPQPSSPLGVRRRHAPQEKGSALGPTVAPSFEPLTYALIHAKTCAHALMCACMKVTGTVTDMGIEMGKVSTHARERARTATDMGVEMGKILSIGRNDTMGGRHRGSHGG